MHTLLLSERLRGLGSALMVDFGILSFHSYSGRYIQCKFDYQYGQWANVMSLSDSLFRWAKDNPGAVARLDDEAMQKLARSYARKMLISAMLLVFVGSLVSPFLNRKTGALSYVVELTGLPEIVIVMLFGALAGILILAPMQVALRNRMAAKAREMARNLAVQQTGEQ